MRDSSPAATPRPPSGPIGDTADSGVVFVDDTAFIDAFGQPVLPVLR